MKKLLFLLPFLFLFFISCKKAKDSSKSRSELIVGNWTAVAFGVDANNDNVLQESEKTPIPAGSSLVETFNANGTGTVTATASGNPPTVTKITWAFVNNDVTLRVNDGSTSTDATIITLTSSELSGFDPSSSPHTIFVFKK